MESKRYTKYFIVTSLLIMLYLFYRLLAPFVVALALAIFLFVLCNPFNIWIQKKLRSKGFGAFVSCVLVLMVIIVPLGFALFALANEAYLFAGSLKSYVPSLLSCKPSEELCSTVQTWFADPQVSSTINDSSGKLIGFLFSRTSDILAGVSSVILAGFISFVALYYFFKDHETIRSGLGILIPLTKSQEENIFREFKETIHGVFYGTMLVGAIQGLLGGLALWVLGFHAPLLWGFIMAILSLLPVLGTAMVWVPISLLLVVQHQYGAGIGLFIYGVLIISSVDNLLRPKLIGSHSRVHPLLMFLSVFGGLNVFGFVGILIGPLIATLFLSMLAIYKREYA
ncbi:AI-2E family transporter [Candidatus Woesearchaeota archaeon]|nr:AI-2E family transporter [Candidatus Woesearchaeota archaeon]